jgi:CCR4-NOT transcription complex subunit 7/8
MELLQRSGLDFERHRTAGIPHALLGEYLTTSGLCLNPNVRWLTFHGGVDFAYILKCLTG